MKKIILKKGKEKPLLCRHHWIFSGAVLNAPKLSPGELVEVYSSEDELLGVAYTNPEGSLFARMLSFGSLDWTDALDKAIEDAVDLRKLLFCDDKTNAYRLINGEGDRIPGLIVDRYGDHLCIQIGTKGIDLIKTKIIDLLLKHMPKIKCIYEKSDLPTRAQESLLPVNEVLYGTINKELVAKENSNLFSIDMVEGQKTGFFLDQREMRNIIGSLAKDKSLVNCFSYSGGFSIYALKAGAKKVRSVDISKKALDNLEQNLSLNNLSKERHESICMDVFNFLKTDSLQDDIVILDPPAFAKKKQDINNACRGYKEINRTALSKMKKGSILLTASCSYHVDENLFQQVLFQAAAEAKRNVKIISKHHLASDHPINIFHPEGSYLKSFILFVQ